MTLSQEQAISQRGKVQVEVILLVGGSQMTLRGAGGMGQHGSEWRAMMQEQLSSTCWTALS